MARGGGSIVIDRPAEEVFAFVADAENNPRWRSYVVDTAWLDDGPMRVGRQGRQVSKVLGRPMAVVAEIAEWDPLDTWPGGRWPASRPCAPTVPSNRKTAAAD